MELRVGGKFRLGRKIGSGSFGDITDGDIPAEDYSVDDDYNSNTNGGYASGGMVHLPGLQ